MVASRRSAPTRAGWSNLEAQSPNALSSSFALFRRNLLASSRETATIDASGWRDPGRGPGSTEANFIDWLTFRDNAKSIVIDVQRIRSYPPGAVIDSDLWLYL